MPVVVTREHGSAGLEDLALRAVGDRDVVVRIDASGICHSDVAVLTGELPSRLPVALGHEGAGTVVEVGPAVSTAAVGDRVVLSAIPPCGVCWFCSRGSFNLCQNAERIGRPGFMDGTTPVRGASGLGTFSDVMVLDERVVVPVQSALTAAQLSLIGCAVLTGAGTVLNIATVGAGTSVMVVGAGGIGLSAVQAARAQGALPIAVVDPSDQARELAMSCGATEAVAPGDAPQLMEVTDGRGFDVVIECVANAATFEMAWPLTRRGGEIVLVGVAPRDVQFPIPIVDVVLSGRRVTGCVYGGSSVHRDIPRYAAMAEAGALDLQMLIGRTIPLAEAPAALLEPPTAPGRTVIVNE